MMVVVSHALGPWIESNDRTVVPAKTLMPIMLVQEHKDKTITHTVHEVLTWFNQKNVVGICISGQVNLDESELTKEEAT